MIHLAETEYRVLQHLVEDGTGEIGAIAAAVQTDQSRVHAACIALEGQDFVQLTEQTHRELSLEADHPVLPERLVIQALDAMGGRGAIPDIPAHAAVDARGVGQSLRFLKAKGWATQQGRELILTDSGRAALDQPGADEHLLQALADGAVHRDQDLEGLDEGLDEALALLAKRKGLVKIKDRVERTAILTVAGRQAWAEGVSLRRQVNGLTSEMLLDGSWRDVDFRPYDVSLDTEPAAPGKTHPFRRILDETRRVFLELGFDEIVSPMCESSFWDFDALFQPQDHPAREMQDTFYVGQPGRVRLPDPGFVDQVRRTHQDGGDTGSVGWRYSWDQALASRPVLRTHTTAATVRAMADDPTGPRKVFCVGPVFRRETVDYKHLPVFYQVDGVVIDEDASFATLLGILDAFYRKMGFKKFDFRPAFFPYTEPSVEIFVWFDEKKDWVEMGGAGVFRPEVTEPTGCTHPVLAWGLGLERLAMLRHGLSDIRQLYISDLDWLRRAPLCR